MNTNEKITAKKLTLEEIKALPFAAVVWVAFEFNNDGIIWHEITPAVVVGPGENGLLMGVDEGGYYEKDINDNILDDSKETFWNFEPDDKQLRGITAKEYNESPNEEEIIFPKLAEAITGKKMTFNRFCDQMGIDFDFFWAAMTGKREFVMREISRISTVLHLTDDEIREIFFPEFAGQVFDIRTGKRIKQPVTAQI